MFNIWMFKTDSTSFLWHFSSVTLGIIDDLKLKSILYNEAVANLDVVFMFLNSVSNGC